MPLQQAALRIDCSRQRDLLRLGLPDSVHNSAGVPHLIPVLLGSARVDLASPDTTSYLHNTKMYVLGLQVLTEKSPPPLELKKQATHTSAPTTTNPCGPRIWQTCTLDPDTVNFLSWNTTTLPYRFREPNSLFGLQPQRNRPNVTVVFVAVLAGLMCPLDTSESGQRKEPRLKKCLLQFQL